MSGVSWRGDAAATRRHAFDRLQEACAEEEAARARLAEARAAAHKAERAVAEATTVCAAAVASTHSAVEALLRAVPGISPADYTAATEAAE